MGKRYKYVATIRELEENTMRDWVSRGVITCSSTGTENLYFTDEFRNEFFCKCYPNRKGFIFPERI